MNEEWQRVKDLLVDPSTQNKKAIMAQVLQNTKAALDKENEDKPTFVITHHEDLIDDGGGDPYINLLETIRKHYKLPKFIPEPKISSANIGTLNRVILPVIRRVMPSIIANEIIGCQPMSGPATQIFSLRQRYSELYDEGDPYQKILTQIKKRYLMKLVDTPVQLGVSKRGFGFWR